MRPTKTSHCFQVKGKKVKFTSNFDSGNLRTVTHLSTFSFLVESALDTYQVPASSKSFFHFKIQNYPIQEHIKLIIKNANLLECIKPERRIYYRPCFSYNGLDYQRLPNTNSVIKSSENGLVLQINLIMKKSTIFFAFSLPYSYQRYLNMIRDLPDSNKQFYLRKQVLCYTKNLHSVYMVTITSYDRKTNDIDEIGKDNNFILPQRQWTQSRPYFNKPVILISARVHPGESPSSWAIEGIIKFIIGNSQQAKILRKYFQFIIVPMLNPDGVYEGMYRLDTQCHNLNRYYLISDNRQPSIYGMKHLMKHFNQSKRLLFFFDFHGHPSYKGSFIYGNAIDQIAYQSETQLFGRIMSINCDTFEQKYCIFDRQQMSSKDKYDMYSKEGCARVYAFKTANILHSYTVEMGFHGCTQFPQNSNKDILTFCYTGEDYYKEGIAVLKCVLEACSLTKSQLNKNQLRKQISEQILTREARFKKQDRFVNIKRKYVNQTIQNQYWSSIRAKYFLPESPSKQRKASNSRRKIISRTSIITTCIFKQNEEKQGQRTIDQENRQKNGEIMSSIETELKKRKSSQRRMKRQQLSQWYFSSKKYREKDYLIAKKQDQSQTTKKIQIDKNFQAQKTIQRIKRRSSKTISDRKLLDVTPTIKPLSQNYQQSMFNDINMRKSIPEINMGDGNSYSFISAQKVTQRVDELKQIFRLYPNMNTKKKPIKTYKKCGNYFT